MAYQRRTFENNKMIPYSRQLIDGNDISAVLDALKDDITSYGRKVDEFEKAICDYRR